MAVSKELKEYLSTKMHQEIKTLEDAVAVRRKINREQALQHDSDLKALTELCNKTIQSIDELVDVHGVTLTYRLKDARYDLTCLPNKSIPQELVDAGTNELQAKKDVVIGKYDMLLLKLSLEKKFDKINEILTEAGIGL